MTYTILAPVEGGVSTKRAYAHNHSVGQDEERAGELEGLALTDIQAQVPPEWVDCPVDLFLHTIRLAQPNSPNVFLSSSLSFRALRQPEI